MKDLNSLRKQGYIDDIPLEYSYEFTNLQLKRFLKDGTAYQKTMAIRILNKRIGTQKDYQKQLKSLLKDNLAYYTRQEIESFLTQQNQKVQNSK